MLNFAQEIIVKNNLDGDSWARKPRAEYPGCTVLEFIEKILIHKTSIQFSIKEGWGEQTTYRVLKKILVPVFGQLHGGNETWARVLLQSIEIKMCPNCATYKRYIEYGKDIHNFHSICPVCRVCKNIRNNAYYDANKDGYYKTYVDMHRGEYNARNAKRRANKVSATPSWANLDIIKRIYECCPEDCHVDHIVPLQGANVCGLHVEYNLQYLTVEENLAKGNKFLG